MIQRRLREEVRGRRAWPASGVMAGSLELSSGPWEPSKVARGVSYCQSGSDGGWAAGARAEAGRWVRRPGSTQA